MIMKLVAMVFFTCSLPGISAGEDTLRSTALENFTPVPIGTPELKNNPVTPEKIELGKMLFFDPRLSKSTLISCNTCHNIGMGG